MLEAWSPGQQCAEGADLHGWIHSWVDGPIGRTCRHRRWDLVGGRKSWGASGGLSSWSLPPPLLPGWSARHTLHHATRSDGASWPGVRLTTETGLSETLPAPQPTPLGILSQGQSWLTQTVGALGLWALHLPLWECAERRSWAQPRSQTPPRTNRAAHPLPCGLWPLPIQRPHGRAVLCGS